MTDSELFNWLDEQVVDVIYLDDGTCIDVRGNGVRAAIERQIASDKDLTSLRRFRGES